MIISSLDKLKNYFSVFFVRFLRLIYVLKTIRFCYKAIPTYSLSKHYRVTQEPTNPDFIYGELSVCSFLYLLALIPKNINCKIYDLGCGDGKLLLAAVLFFKNLTAIGIEKIPDLCQVASDRITRNINININIKKNHSCLIILEKSFLDADFSDAHIVYINGSALKNDTWNELYARLQKLNPESYVISVVRKLEGPLFRLIYAGQHTCSWGKAFVYIYQNVSNCPGIKKPKD